MIRVEETRKERYKHSILGHVDQRRPAPKTEIRNPESVRHTAVRELNLTGSQFWSSDVRVSWGR